MPTLDEMMASVYSDVADDAREVFSDVQIGDFIRGGIVELNRVQPQDIAVVIDLTTDPTTGDVTQFAYTIPINLPYRVEWRRHSDGYGGLIGEAVEGQTASTGWTFSQIGDGGTIEFPQFWLAQFDAASNDIIVHGYGTRPIPYNSGGSSPQVGLTSAEEYSVRAYAKAEAYDLLAHDRSLFAQWQGQTNNSDVSPTQMMQMAAGSKQEWDRHRGLIRTVRRYW